MTRRPASHSILRADDEELVHGALWLKADVVESITLNRQSLHEHPQVGTSHPVWTRGAGATRRRHRAGQHLHP